MRRILVIAMIAVMCFAQPAVSQVTRSLSAKEARICKDLDMCVDILLRHGPDEFDYYELSKEFQRFGPRGSKRLLRLVKGRRQSGVENALDILSFRNWRFSPQEQKQIAELWPNVSPKKLTQVMENIPSPMMRDEFIATLSHETPSVRNLSRQGLAELLKKMKAEAPIAPQYFGALAKAAVTDPTPEIVSLLSQHPDRQSSPILQRVLLSEDEASVIRAYEILYAQDPETAFQSLLSALKTIERPEQALAISALLRKRHSGRADGFYLKFAADLAADTEFPMIARMVGVDAVMGNVSENIVSLKQRSEEAFNKTVSLEGIDFSRYLLNFKDKTGDEAGKYLSAIWKGLGSLDGQLKRDLVHSSWWHDGPETLEIYRDGLNDKIDWRVVNASALALARRNDTASVSKLLDVSKAHPIDYVKVSSMAAYEAIKLGDIDPDSITSTVYSSDNDCKIIGESFVSASRQMPFFDESKIEFNLKKSLNRSDLSASKAMKNGWLAGYTLEYGEGGLVYFDNKYGEAEIILRANVLAIIPTQIMSPGKYSQKFWVVTGQEREGSVFILKDVNGSFRIEKKVQLPGLPIDIKQDKDGSVLFGFSENPKIISTIREIDPDSVFYELTLPHVPMRLLPEGGLVKGCPAGSNHLPKSDTPPN